MKPSIAEQIAWQRSDIKFKREYGSPVYGVACAEAILATLTQHERAMAVVEAARPTASPSQCYLDKPGSMAKLRAALAALDTAETEKR